MEIYLPTDVNSLNSADQLYDIPAFGNVSLLHFTDCHAQLLPIYYREPSINLGIGSAEGKVPHLVGVPLLDAYGIRAGSRQAYAFSHLDFCAAARAYGKVGGFAHLASLVKRLKASRPNALLLDGGDSWQGSATALWTAGQDMVEASLELGVDVMTSTPNSSEASTMSCPAVHSAVAEPCQLSPPSSSKALGRLAFRRLTRLARCAKPPTLP